MSNRSDGSSGSPDPVGEVVPDLSASPALLRAELRGRETTLRPLDASGDAASLFAVSHGTAESERIWTYLGYGPFDDVDAMREFLGECERSDDPLFFTVVDTATGRPVGVVSFLAVDRTSRCLELGHIWYAPSHQRGRTNTETIYIMLREAFERLRCRRVEWKCDSLNRRSRRAAERLGFTYESLFRQHKIVKGRNRDTAWFSIVDSEWPTVRAALERWLDWPEGRPPSLASLRARLQDDPTRR